MNENRRAQELISEGEKAINAGTLKLLEKDAEKCERMGRRIFGISIALGVLLLIGALWLSWDRLLPFR